MLSEQDLHTVRNLHLFDSLTDGELILISRDAVVRTIEKGATLFHRGDAANFFFAVLNGWMKLTQDRPTGEVAVLGVFGRGETFAEAAMFMSKGYPATAEAVEKSRILCFPRETVKACIAQNPNIAFTMLGSVSRHLHAMAMEIEQLKTRNGEQRLAKFLLRFCDRRTGASRVVLPFEKSLIAERLGMKPESLSRNLSKLNSVGVSVDGQTVHIADVERLFSYCESAPYRRNSRR